MAFSTAYTPKYQHQISTHSGHSDIFQKRIAGTVYPEIRLFNIRCLNTQYGIGNTGPVRVSIKCQKFYQSEVHKTKNDKP